MKAQVSSAVKSTVKDHLRRNRASSTTVFFSRSSSDISCFRTCFTYNTKSQIQNRKGVVEDGDETMSACENHESETKKSFLRVQIFIDLFIHLVPPNSGCLSFGPWICQSFQIWHLNINHLCFGPWCYLIIDTSLISRLNSADCISDLCFRSERIKITLFSFQTKIQKTNPNLHLF